MKIRILALILICFVLGIMKSEAKQHYYGSLLAAYPNNKLQNIKCMVCHDGRGMNSFGKDFVKLVRPSYPNLNFRPLDNLDSDQDGISNTDEINNGSNPGKASN